MKKIRIKNFSAYFSTFSSGKNFKQLNFNASLKELEIPVYK
ncbi:hypothetical protein PHEL49_2288 [Polaribacter sp. Hel1_33_49]|nr:hypothetical protein PHEL49_2288 [Polaribacter sp. Hel1_33_49]